MKRTCVYFFVFIASLLLSFLPSDTPIDRLIAGFTWYLYELPQEKVYLYLDRPYNSSVETISIKTYLSAGAFHLPSSLSNTIYVELINGEGELLKQLRLLAINGSAAGDIMLSDSLASGNYLV